MNALVAIDSILNPDTIPAPVSLFGTGHVETILTAIEKEVRSELFDISTEEGRERIKSVAYKIARSKTTLDDIGKEYVADIKAQSAKIDKERKTLRDRLDALKEEVRSPLTVWEDAETARVDGHEKALVWIIESPRFATTPTVAMIEAQVSDLNGLSGRDWQEFGERADAAITEARAMLSDMLRQSKQAERDATELAELRRLKAEREAADLAEAAAKAEADRKAQEAEAIAKREVLLAAQAKRDQLAAVAHAIEEAEAKAKADIARAEQAARDAEAATARAVEVERQRAAAAKAADEAAEQKRQANKRHCAKINNEALAALIMLGVTEDIGKALIVVIATKQIPHVSISY